MVLTASFQIYILKLPPLHYPDVPLLASSMTCAYRLILPLLLLLSPAPLLAVTVDIDDTDTRIVYTGTWSPTGEYQASNNTAQYDNTATLCREVGGTASLVFIGESENSFLRITPHHKLFIHPGTSVTVFCTRGPIGTWLENTSYSLDSGPVSLWTDNNTINSVQWRTTCYSSGDVPYGEHNITITNYGDWFFLDYIQIVTPNPPSGSPSSSEDSVSLTICCLLGLTEYSSHPGHLHPQLHCYRHRCLQRLRLSLAIPPPRPLFTRAIYSLLRPLQFR